jgi:nucleolin
LFVGNLDFGTTPEQLRMLFEEAGEVVEVSVPVDRDTGRARGFAFVEMSSSDQAATARERFHGFELGGRPLRVDVATEKPARFGGGGPGSGSSAAGRGFAPGPRSRPKGSRRNVRARKRGF